MNEAGQVLTDAVQRREYDSRLRKAGREIEEAEHVQRVLRAATSFQKAEVFLKRSNLAAAEVEARQALADDADAADHIALVAWIEAQKPGADLQEALSGLNRALQVQPNNLRAHWYRGQIYKRLDKMHRAIRDFKFVVERDPRHVDALRELRLYMMRRGGRATSIPPSGGEGAKSSPAPSTSEKPKGEGLISKLFKR
jgi:tetratricopeptide (TPR) repeat protein